MKLTGLRKLGIIALGLLPLVVATGCSSDGGDTGAASGDETATETDTGQDSSADQGSDFPEGNITMVIPFDAGGSTDLSARTLGSEMESELGVSIIAENRSGASGSIGMGRLAESDPDGYTIGILTVEAAMLGHQGYDIDVANYDVLGQVVSQSGAIAVPADSPYETLNDILAAAESEPGAITVSNSGAAGNWEAVATGLQQAANVEFSHVPFEGGAAAVTAAMGGQVDAVVAGISEVIQAHNDGQIRVLAVLDAQQSSQLPDVPTAQSLGVDVSMGSWHIIAAPAGLPENVRETLVAAVKVAQESDSFRTVIENSGNAVFYRGPEETTEFLDAESQRFADFYASIS